jgi:hypothetical protein
MDRTRREEFKSILARVASVPRPLLDYSTFSNATFAGCEFIRRLMEIQCGLMLFFRSTGQLPVTQDGLNLILTRSMEITLRDLAEDYELCGEREITALLAHLKIEELFIGAEIEKRLADKRIGTAIILVPFFEGSKPIEKWLTKELRVDKIKAHGKDKAVEDYDIRGDSVMRALKMAANLESSSYEPGPLPAFPLEMNHHEASFWNGYLAKVWMRGHTTLRQGLIPVLNGDAERIPKQVRECRREDWKKIARHKRFLEGTDKFPTNGPEAWRADWDFSERAAVGRYEDIKPETMGDILQPEESLSAREIGAEAYDYVRAQHGEQGRIYLDTLIATEGNVSKASQAADVSRVTGHKWRTEIRNFISKKNPAK